MRIYNIDFQEILRMNIFRWVRDKLMIAAIISSCATELNATKDDLLQYRLSVEHTLQYNGQVCYLRKALNDAYDNTLRRIYIKNEQVIPFFILQKRAELLPVLINRRSEASPTLINRRDIIIYSNSFIVYCPTSLQPYEAVIIQTINDYKLVSKTFKIEYI